MAKARRHLSDEDAAFAAAQWASGVKQREIAAGFGYSSNVAICLMVRRFLEKYGGLPSWADAPTDRGWRMPGGAERKRLVKAAIARFVATRG